MYPGFWYSDLVIQKQFDVIFGTQDLGKYHRTFQLQGTVFDLFFGLWDLWNFDHWRSGVAVIYRLVADFIER